MTVAVVLKRFNACIKVRHIEITTPFLKWWLSRIYVTTTIILVLLAFKLV